MTTSGYHRHGTVLAPVSPDLGTWSRSWGSTCTPFSLVLAAIAAALPQSPAQPAPKAASASPGLDLQTRLDRAGFSPGEIDGRPGMVTRKAVAAFQQSRKLPATGRADAATLAALAEAAPGDTVVAYQVTAEDVAGPFTEHIPEDMMERATLPALNYSSALEELSERFHASPALLSALNPERSIHLCRRGAAGAACASAARATSQGRRTGPGHRHRLENRARAHGRR